MGNRKSVRQIIKKYLKGETTAEEEQQLFTFYEYIDQDKTDWEDDKHGDKEAVEQRILQNIQRHIEDDLHRKKSIRSLFSPWKVAAAIVLLCSAAVIAWNRHKTEPDHNPVAAEIQPGSDKALLQFSDGRTVYLDSSATGELSTTAGSVIHIEEEGTLVYTTAGESNSDSEMNTITVPKGGQYKVILADGTSVWLNASSSLSFPTHFAGSERRVKLVGEAYFEVSKHIQKGSSEKTPFLVETAEQVVEVLGTSFNINAYADEQMVRTTLLTGAVSVKPTEGETQTILKPGEQSMVADGQVAVKHVNTDQSVAWKQGDFSFDDMPLEEIMRQVARWYDIDVSYQDEIGKVKFGGSISRSKDIREVLDILTLTGVHFTIKGRRIMVTP